MKWKPSSTTELLIYLSVLRAHHFIHTCLKKALRLKWNCFRWATSVNGRIASHSLSSTAITITTHIFPAPLPLLMTDIILFSSPVYLSRYSSNYKNKQALRVPFHFLTFLLYQSYSIPLAGIFSSARPKYSTLKQQSEMRLFFYQRISALSSYNNRVCDWEICVIETKLAVFSYNNSFDSILCRI
jgi:hypothetical protein